MGLSASQARLLTITARKSDCEYESMRLSHQKIALSRDMDVISAEYQDAINQTNLMYDFYGNNTQANPLTYGLLMSPSALNDYIPTTITDKSGRVVLNPALARAAKAAGIPQEGMDGLPSSEMRNAFIDGLVANDVITDIQGENIKKTTYNQMAGVGSEDLVNVNTAECSYTDLKKMLESVTFDLTDIVSSHSYSGGQGCVFELWESQRAEDGTITGYQKCADVPDNISLGDILNGNYVLRGSADHQGDEGNREFKSWELLVDMVGSSTFWDNMFEGVENLLDTGDEYTQAALEYAKNKILDSVELLGQRDDSGGGNVDYSNFAFWKQLKGHLIGNNSNKSILENVDKNVNNYVGIVYIENSAREDEGKYNDGYGLNISYMAQAYLTYFAEYMQGISNSDYNVEQLREQCNFVDDMFTFEYVTDVDTSGDNLLVAGFYDALFNQICLNGWTENENIDDREYLEEMLKSGAMYMSTMSDDGYYYQGSYSTNTYIKEVTDETAVAQAEAKYNREKQKINAKENIIDMKMKNLDTEISALTTEYDTVKSVIDKNIEKTFKRYDA